MASSPIATPAPWSPSKARSSGCACRASTRPASSPPCWIAAPATSSSAPRGVVVPLSRRYEPGTLVIETTWVTDTGWVVIHDALTIGEWAAPEGPGLAPETEHESDRSLLRTATCVDGEVELEMECLPRFGYGVEAADWSGGELGEAVARAGDGTELRLTSDMESDPRRRRGSRPGAPARGRDRLLRADLGRRRPGRARAAPRRRSSGSTRPRSSGAHGCATANSPTTPGASTCSAPRWC